MNQVATLLKSIFRRPTRSARKMKLFKPRQFEQRRSLFSLGTMSMSYWDLAEEFKARAIEDLDHKPALYSIYVFPSIIMYCATVEALINENLAILGSQTDDQAIQDDIRSIRRGLDPYRELPARLRRAYEVLNKATQPPVTDEILQDFQALSELRNAIIHYCPEYVDVLQWPQRLRQVLERSNAPPVEADWTITFRTKPVLLWADQTSKRLISTFLRITNGDENRFFNKS